MVADDEAEVHALTGAYALDALAEDERVAFEAHLAECASCGVEVDDLLRTAARLGSIEEVSPPPRMKAAVMAAASRTRQLAPAAPVHGDVALATVTDLAGRRRRRAVAVLGVAAGLLAVVAVALGAQNAALRSDRSELQARSVRDASVVAEVNQVLTAGDARTVSAAVGGDGHGAVVSSAALDRAVFVGRGLATPPPGRTYQLWLITATGKASPAGVFRPDATGAVAASVKGTLVGNALVGLTVEPNGGSLAPTTAPILAVPLRA